MSQLRCPHCASRTLDQGATGLDECKACGGLSRNGRVLHSGGATQRRSQQRITRQNERIDRLESNMVFLIAENITLRQALIDIVETLQTKGDDHLSAKQYEAMRKLGIQFSINIKPVMDQLTKINKQLIAALEPKNPHGPHAKRRGDGE